MLQVNNLNCCRGDRCLWQNLNFSVDQQQLLLVTGQNGAGKTSLLRILAGLGRFYQGQVNWRKVSIAQLKSDYQQQIHFLGHSNAIKNELTVEENLLLNSGYSVKKSQVHAIIKLLELTPCLKRFGQELSQGQKQKVALARLFLKFAPLMILDEPFAHLDSSMIEKLQMMLADYLSQGGILILSTHMPLTNSSLTNAALKLEL
ncbi:MAG: cytochrome c biogenesis heme-transporting ATPase CcmA [Proteobacteria bacterium]|nr:cytochrome c biogenesis heme-transporting ATPase CcmA [Pseudomonadota bacterium]